MAPSPAMVIREGAKNRQYVRVLSFWFSGVAALAWVLVAVFQFARDEKKFAVLAGAAALCFAAAFVLRLLERRSRT